MRTASPNTLFIIGGVAGGASAAARAQRLCEDCEIVVFERGEHVSFTNSGGYLTFRRATAAAPE